MSEENIDHDARFDLDGGQWEALRSQINEPENLGTDHGIACNVTDSDHVHVRRVGTVGSGLGGRVAVATHAGQSVAVVYVAAPQARTLAAHLLNAADDLDGLTPLTFHPPRVADEAETPLADVPVPLAEPETPGLVGLLFGLAALPFGIARRLL